jgi:hypothetical protein
MKMDDWLASPPAAGKEAIMRVCVLIACLLAVPGAAMAEDFLWQAHLGISSENLQTELVKFSSCDFIKPLSFTIRYPIPASAKITIRDWHNPIPVTWFSDEDAPQSSIIRELDCSADMRVHINALIFENIVFDITIKYARCDLRDSTCDPLAPTSIDKSFASKLPEEIVYAPFWGAGTRASDMDLSQQTYSSLLSDSYLHERLSDAGDCRPISDKYRCIVRATTDDGVWHSITITEAFESGFFSERILGRFASSQRFTLIDVDKRARAAFASEIQAVLENRDRLDQEKNRIRELRETPLQSAR